MSNEVVVPEIGRLVHYERNPIQAMVPIRAQAVCKTSSEHITNPLTPASHIPSRLRLSCTKRYREGGERSVTDGRFPLLYVVHGTSFQRTCSG